MHSKPLHTARKTCFSSKSSVFAQRKVEERFEQQQVEVHSVKCRHLKCKQDQVIDAPASPLLSTLRAHWTVLVGVSTASAAYI
eukprot:7276-Heterococcus_DN1.PRE.1